MTILEKRSIGLALSMLLPIVATAQTTTPSIEATSKNGTQVNEIRLPGGPAERAAAAPDPIVSVSAYQRFVGLAIPASSAGTQTALRVTLTSLYHPDDPQPTNQPNYSSSEGQFRYMRLFHAGNGDTVTECISSNAFGTTYPCIFVGCEPEYADWGTLFGGRTAYVTGNAIIPDSTFTVSHLAASCAGNEATCTEASAEVAVATARWGDSEPDGRVNVTDVVNTVDATKELIDAFWEYRVYGRSSFPQPHLSSTGVTDIVNHVDAVKLTSYVLPVFPCP